MGFRGVAPSGVTVDDLDVLGIVDGESNVQAFSRVHPPDVYVELDLLSFAGESLGSKPTMPNPRDVRRPKLLAMIVSRNCSQHGQADVN